VGEVEGGARGAQGVGLDECRDMIQVRRGSRRRNAWDDTITQKSQFRQRRALRVETVRCPKYHFHGLANVACHDADFELEKRRFLPSQKSNDQKCHLARFCIHSCSACKYVTPCVHPHPLQLLRERESVCVRLMKHKKESRKAYVDVHRLCRLALGSVLALKQRLPTRPHSTVSPMEPGESRPRRENEKRKRTCPCPS
jgi:hypothetical protein